MTTRREAIMTAVTALGAAICDALDIPEADVSEPVPEDPEPTVPAEPVQYGAILEPEEPIITQEEASVGAGGINRKAGQSIAMKDAWWSDNWIGWKGNDSGANPLADVSCEDVFLERFGPLIVMRGAPSIYLNRIMSIEASVSSYGIGFLRATDTIGKLRAHNLTFRGEREITNANDAFAAICLWGKDGDTCTDWEISRFDFRNVIMAAGNNYANADGISVERGHDLGLIEHGVIKNVSDAGIDCKGENCRINQVDIEGARQSLKLWDASDKHGRIISRSPRFAHIIAKPGGSTEAIVIDRLEAPDAPTKPIVAFESGPRKVVINTLIAPEEQKLFSVENAAEGSQLWINGSQVL